LALTNARDIILEKDVWQVDTEKVVHNVKDNKSRCITDNDWSMYCKEELESNIHYQQYA